jgi:hypothetical protein
MTAPVPAPSAPPSTAPFCQFGVLAQAPNKRATKLIDTKRVLFMCFLLIPYCCRASFIILKRLNMDGRLRLLDSDNNGSKYIRKLFFFHQELEPGV